MKIEIYGKDDCSYCKRAVELAKQLKTQGHGDYEYIDIVATGIDAATGRVSRKASKNRAADLRRRRTYWRIHRAGGLRLRSVTT